uniref:Guanine nucleotide binding protein (G protein) alpha v1 n=1 Tax=Fundulus heteroclitus TaxID=8078 RepID=A0A3Q2PT77_FUNHE
MGLCLGTEDTEEKTARVRSAKIDRELYESAKREMNVVKILILGAAESGKSTLVKQMKIIHSNGFTKQELSSFKPAVLDNLLTSMKFVLHGMGVLRINLANNRNKVHAHSVLSCGRCFDEEHVPLPFLSHALSCLWADQGVRAAAARGYEYELNDSALYFFENMSRITSPDYVPTETDVLRVRLRTTGVIETQFKVNHLIFRYSSLSVSRTEFRFFLLVYTLSLLCFEPTLLVCLLQILFMNKIDLFEDKISHTGRHLRLYWPKFKGADYDVDSAARFIVATFVSLSKSPKKLIYHHFTTATDTSNIQVVFQVVMETIIKENLEAVSLL